MEEILEKTRQFVLETMAQNDAAHDIRHVQRVVALTEQLCAACPEADGFRARLLAWVHDLYDDKLRSNLGIDAIADFLRSIGTREEDVGFILLGLPYISYRRHPSLSREISLEIRIVQDADRIDAMGAIGIARTFAYGGAKGRSLEDGLLHFDEKLLRLYDLLGTEVGKQLAKPRYDFLRAFYDQFKAENH